MGVFPMFSRYEGFSHLFMRLLDDKLHRSFSFQGKRKILFYRYHAFNNNTPQLQEVMFFWQNCRCTLMLPFVFVFIFYFFSFLTDSSYLKGLEEIRYRTQRLHSVKFHRQLHREFFQLVGLKMLF